MPSHQTMAVNPSLLAWAREESGYELDQVAKRLQVKGERLVAWEKGERQPTMRQVEALARFLHRPLSVFFLPRPPQLSPLAAEYRRLPDVEPGHESPELRLALRQMLIRRENMLNLMGVLVFQFSKVELQEVRGLALLRTPLPVAAINGKEMPEARAFTLFHEIVHLMLAAGNEEAPAVRERRKGDEWMAVERFAEAAASHTLVPGDSLRDVVGQFGLQRAAWDIEKVRRVAKKFRLTPLAMATRLRESGFMDWEQYNQWREQWQAYVATLPPRHGGFTTPMQKALNRAGRPFAQLVLEALAANRITPVNASRYLDLK